MLKTIEDVRYKYKILYLDYKPYEKKKTAETLYNDTSYGFWYFAPKINMEYPFEAVICLIWTPSSEFKIKPDWSFTVSYPTN